jgi:hypothetical protein
VGNGYIGFVQTSTDQLGFTIYGGNLMGQGFVTTEG